MFLTCSIKTDELHLLLIHTFTYDIINYCFMTVVLLAESVSLRNVFMLLPCGGL